MEISEIYQRYMESGKVSTDTRKIVPKSMFFALKGDNFNGNEFAHQALESGASYAVVDEKEYAAGNQTILVENVLETLQRLSAYHRDKLAVPVIAVTGSNGKTTSKELIREVLANKFNVAYTKGNLNNHIGVPLTLLDLDASHEIALVEMGDNHPKEVEFLCTIAQPQYGFITNVGKDHLEGFGSFDNNVLAKKEIFDYLQNTGGKAFVDLSDSLVAGMANDRIEKITYGTPQAFSYIEFVESNPFVVFRDELGSRVETQIFGKFNFNNIQLAYCIGKYFDVRLTDISKALSEYAPDNNRSQVLKTRKNTLIMDAYNANPSSVEEAVDSFGAMQTDKPKWLILGDMFELGSYSETEHQAMAEKSGSFGFDEVILIGENYAKTDSPDEVLVFAEKKDAEEYIKKIAPEGAIILLKGSRGMRLETLKDIL